MFAERNRAQVEVDRKHGRKALGKRNDRTEYRFVLGCPVGNTKRDQRFTKLVQLDRVALARNQRTDDTAECLLLSFGWNHRRRGRLYVLLVFSRLRRRLTRRQ